tara:strand:+ start:913 stop:1026 length:114 start_codon:yes stop_codon:yes gene_type:complete
MKSVLLVAQLSAVSPCTETETEEDKAGEGVKVLEGED